LNPAALDLSNPAVKDEKALVSIDGSHRPTPAVWAAIGLVAAVIIYFYGIHHAYPSAAGRSLAHWTWLACNPINDFVHGRVIPLAFGIMAFLSWKIARTEERKPSLWGLAGLAIGIGLYLLSVRTIQPRLALFGIPFLILGGTTFLFGFKVSRHFIFPAFFWYFAIPIPGIQQATALLQVGVTKLCFAGGTALGMELVNDGNTITSVGAKAWQFDIAEGCSGIRSLMALAMISAIYANYTQKETWKKILLFACALPLSLIGNLARIFTIMLLAHFGFKDFAAKTYHDWAGLLIFFPIALAGLFVIDSLLNHRSRAKKRLVRRIAKQPKHAAAATTEGQSS
jgi:exosortase